MHYFKAISELKLELQSGNAKFRSKLVICFFPCVTLKFDGWPWKTIGYLFYATSSFVYYFVAIDQFKPKLQSGNPIFGSKSVIFFVPCDLKIWRMDLKNNWAPLLCYFKLCVSFHSHRSIQIGVTVRKLQIWVKIGDFLSRVTLKFDGWPWKPIGPPFRPTSSFAHHFAAICELKLQLWSGKRPIRVKIGDFLSRMTVTLKFDRCPWKTVGHLSYATSSFVRYFIAICELKLKLVRKRLNLVLTPVTLNCDLWPWPFA